jgi:hypothetical protein
MVELASIEHRLQANRHRDLILNLKIYRQIYRHNRCVTPFYESEN